MAIMLSEAARQQYLDAHPVIAHANPRVDWQPSSDLSTVPTLSPNQNPPVGYASFRQRLARPQHNAQPVSEMLSTQTRLRSTGPLTEDSAPLEHMLRRKTPNGTLAAGYDGSPVEWATRPHASKHFLLRPSINTVNTPNRIPLSDSNSIGQQNHPQPDPPAQVNRHQNADPIENLKTDLGRGQSFMSLAGFDSVLNQSSLQTQQYRLAGDHQAPIALQPMWPPCLGFTTIQNPGPIGPYWPDGVYEPYRPATRRDPRFQSGDIGNLVKASSPKVQIKPNDESWLQDYDDRNNYGIQQVADRSQNFDNIERTVHSSDHFSGSFENQQAPFESHQNSLKEQYGALLPYRNKVHSSKEQQSQILNNAYSNLTLSALKPPQNAHQQFRSPICVEGSSQFKEKVLAWAHQIYSTLLACIEQARRSSSNEQQRGQHHSSFYPQPPRRRYPSWSHGNNRRDFPDVAFSHSLPSSVDAMSGYQTPFTFQQTPSSRTTVFQANHGAPFPISTQDPRTNHPRSISRTAQASYVPFHIAEAQTPDNPPAAATQAMEILSRLCEESNWTWTDGMLLNGCLAYGLSEYDKAMKWYLKVLQCDPSNVEAMSNLAATLILFDRRQEAEQFWIRAIKLRPSYFEAVEHLVGLLHEGHRGREAVKIVEYMEQALRCQPTTAIPNVVPQMNPLQNLNFSKYAIPPSENGRLLALIHGKGNVLYQIGDNTGAARAFEDAILIGAGRSDLGIQSLIKTILSAFSDDSQSRAAENQKSFGADQPVLLPPEVALGTSQLVFPPHGRLPGLEEVPAGISHKAAISIVSNSLLSLAKIYQDGMSSSGASAIAPRATSGVQEILALYYLSLSLQPSPSTANNVGILLAGVQQSARLTASLNFAQSSNVPGVVPGSGIALALAYYDYGLKLDAKHAHLYTNLGSLFKDIGQLNAAIKMYEQAVECDSNFDIALANLANAVKDKGDVGEAINYYRRAVVSNPDFAEAVCGLANALNSVCKWDGRGGIQPCTGIQDCWHVDDGGLLYDSRRSSIASRGWIQQVVAIVDKQLLDGQNWGKHILRSVGIESIMMQLLQALEHPKDDRRASLVVRQALVAWSIENWEGARVVRLIERATKRLGWQTYQDKYIEQRPVQSSLRVRPQLPAALAIPGAPTVLPFHTFTCPLSAKQIRRISQRNGLRVSCTTLRASWLPDHIFEPPPPPSPHLNVGYVSSDFNNHPLAHLMQSVFGLHDRSRVKATCYATTASDGSVHRRQIEREAPAFHDASSWSIERLVNQIVADRVHILVNLNGYTRGAKNEVFAARPAPIQMSFMGFAGTLGAEWCDYLLADQIAVPPQTLRPWRNNVDLVDQTQDGNNEDDQQDDWVYGENVIYTRDTFFCCDHRQSAPDARDTQLSWPAEQQRRWKMRKELFPDLQDDAVILGNFNQLYKIEPTTFRLWLRILSRVRKAVLWLLRFPDLGEKNLKQTALLWVGQEVASRIIFTDVAPKHKHIARATICDLFLDTPECNAHTTAADVLWSGTPLLTYPRYDYKMCSRMAASILKGALPKTSEGTRAFQDLVVANNEAYEEQGVELASDLIYRVEDGVPGVGHGRLVELRKLLYESRWSSALFDTHRWVRDLETAYDQAWHRWVAGEGGDIWL